MPRERKVKHLDGPSLRALAHPLRARLVGSLRAVGPGTATMLGERLGESSGATSYHLRVLARHGFVEDDPEAPATGRERWWRASHTGTTWRSIDFQDDPDERAADAWLMGHSARFAMERIDGWQRRRGEDDPVWLDASDTSDYRLHATPARLRALGDELNAVIQRHVVAADAEDAEDPAARDCLVLLWTFPADEAANSGGDAP